MKLDASEKRRTMAVVAYRGKHFQGYAVKTTQNNWVAVGALGMSWVKWNCLSLTDAQTWLRTTCYAGRFDLYSDAFDLNDIFEKLPPYQQPSITLDSFGSTIAAPTKLQASSMVYFTPT